jgi:hypothetical protein
VEWFRFYHTVVDDAKIQSLPVHLRWGWVELLCLASRNNPRGELPELRDIAFHLRKPPKLARKVIDDLITAKLIDEHDEGKRLVMHNWERRQPKSDDVKTRVDRFRERHENGTCNVTETFHETELKPLTRAHAHSVSVSVSELQEGGAGGNPPDPGPEFEALGKLAVEMSCDLSIGPWVSNMARLGHTAASIRYALEQGAAAGKFGHQWLQAILKRVAVEGIPKHKLANGRSDPGAPKPEDPEHAKRRAAFIKATAKDTNHA